MSTAVAAKALRDFFRTESVEKLSSRLGDPAWLKESRMKGWAAFESGAADPAQSGARWLEEVRKASSWAFDPGAKNPLPAAAAPSLESADWGSLSGHLAFGCEDDGGALLSEEAKKAGAVFIPMKQALKSHEALLKQHLFSRTKAGETSWAGLNAAFFGQGSFLYLPKGRRLEKPFRATGWHTGGHAGFFPRTLVVLDEGAEATLIDEARSASEAPGFCSAVSEYVIAAGAQLNVVTHQALNLQSLAVSRQNTALSRGSYLYTLGLVTGAAWSSAFIGSTLEGEGARLDLLGLVLAGGDQKAEIRTLQDHVARAGESDALVKSILRGHSRFYFDGVVKIYKAGQNSNAFQSNPNLLLSSDAKAESVPTLEIEADDVACKHAASIGSIDEEEKFYLLSRGVNLQDTESIIVEGFAAELAQRLPNEHLQERFVDLLSELAGGGHA